MSLENFILIKRKRKAIIAQNGGSSTLRTVCT